MRMSRFLPLASLVCVSIIPLSNASADEAPIIHVNADGSGDFRTIQEAVDKSPADAVIRIAEGVWSEAVNVSRPLTLEGAGWESTRIVSSSAQEPSADVLRTLEPIVRELDSETQAKVRDAMSKVYGSSPAVTVKDVQGVVLCNLSVLRSEPVRSGGFTSNAAIEIQNASVQLQGCAILESPGTGIVAQGDSDVKVSECLITNCWGKGIVIAVSDQGSFEITDSDIRNNQYSGLSISSHSQSIRVQRCRIHGFGWHGIRYDGCSPTIEGNLFYRTAVSGIYASGQTAALVKNNLFYHSGISCWFQNADTIVSNTFVGDRGADVHGGITQGLQVLGASTPAVRRNIFVSCQNATYVGDINSDSPNAKSTGEVALIENCFWGNERNLARHDKSAEKDTALPLPDGNREQQPKFLDANQRDFHLNAESPLAKAEVGAQAFASFESAWPQQPEEQRTIKAVDERLRQTSGQR